MGEGVQLYMYVWFVKEVQHFKKDTCSVVHTIAYYIIIHTSIRRDRMFVQHPFNVGVLSASFTKPAASRSA